MAIIVAGAGAGWAARSFMGLDRPTARAAPQKPAEPAKEITPDPATSPGPPPPSFLRLGGVTVEDDALVRQFLGLSVRCGVFAGREVHASVLDLLQLRTRGYASPPFHYEVRHAMRDNYDYVVVREAIRQRDGKPFPGAPGYVAHTYYYNKPMDRFELADSTPENPDFNPATLRETGDPLGFLSRHWEAVCNGYLYFHRTSSEDAKRREGAAPAEASTSSAPPASGLGQWSAPAEPRLGAAAESEN